MRKLVTMDKPPTKLDEYKLETELRAIFRRLAMSNGRRIARRNARRTAAGLISRIQNHIQRTYPAIDADGNDMLPPDKIRCPAIDCNSVCDSGFGLVQHIMSKHPGMITGHRQGETAGRLRCVCDRTFKGKTGLAAHLAHQHRSGKLLSHWTIGSTTMFLEGKI
jgi:hypothetical protein